MILHLCIAVGYIIGGYLTLLAWRFIDKEDFEKEFQSKGQFLTAIVFWPALALTILIVNLFDCFCFIYKICDKNVISKIDFRALFFLTDIKKKKEDAVSSKGIMKE